MTADNSLNLTLMRFFKTYPKLTKFALFSAFSGGSGWLFYQVKKTGDIFTNALDTEVLSLDEPIADMKEKKDNYVFIDIQKAQEYQDFSFYSSWGNLKFSLAKRLLILANNDNKFIRTKAVRQLARIKKLDYWQFALLATMIDAKTAVGLARTENVDPRLFIEPPIQYLGHTQTMIINVMKDLLVNLHAKSQHPCMGVFISKAFAHHPDLGYDYDATPLQLKKYIQSTHEVIPMCLETLLHHASIRNYAKDIAELNGLPLLTEIYHRFKDNIDVTATICRIISYLSMHSELLDDLFKSGWIGILSGWRQHPDIRISVPAAKALANMDVDEDALYLQRLYLMHPSTRASKHIEADVVFVHGLLGGVFYTWRQRMKNEDPLGLLGKNNKEDTFTKNPSQETCVVPKGKRSRKHSISDPQMKEFMDDLETNFHERLCTDYEVIWEDIPTNTNVEAIGPFSCPGHKYPKAKHEEDCYTNCWPKDWLAHDCNHLRIIGVNYETNLSLWTPICPVEKVETLEERSDELIDQFMKIGLGKRPIIWITHSMGGLIVKNVLCKAYENNDSKVQDICLNTKGIVFYSTPHFGSSLAKLSQAAALIIWPSTEVQELQLNAPHLVQIHSKFLDISKTVPMEIITFVETNPTVVSALKFKFLIVEPESGNPGVGEYYEIPLDHLGICKPASRHSFLYQKVLHLIEYILLENQRQMNK